jgi:hypothetical protein
MPRIQSPAGRKVMIEELKNIQGSLQRALGVLSAVTDSLANLNMLSLAPGATRTGN